MNGGPIVDEKTHRYLTAPERQMLRNIARRRTHRPSLRLIGIKKIGQSGVRG
jgi:hypothetical protein